MPTAILVTWPVAQLLHIQNLTKNSILGNGKRTCCDTIERIQCVVHGRFAEEHYDKSSPPELVGDLLVAGECSLGAPAILLLLVLCRSLSPLTWPTDFFPGLFAGFGLPIGVDFTAGFTGSSDVTGVEVAQPIMTGTIASYVKLSEASHHFCLQDVSNVDE